MGIPVMILGESGSGKSSSMRNFTPEDEVGIINVGKKPLPFKNKLKTFESDRYEAIEDVITRGKAKTIIIDDAQYLMANEFMRRSGEVGFQKFTDIGKNFWSLVQLVKELEPDRIVYFMGHIERDPEGREKFKTIGKLLDDKITVEGMFTIVLRAECKEHKYLFRTQSNGMDTAKSPMGMFPLEMDNDLKLVDETIRNYYEI